MKQLFMVAITLLALTSCKKESTPQNPNCGRIYGYTITGELPIYPFISTVDMNVRFYNGSEEVIRNVRWSDYKNYIAQGGEYCR